VGFCGEEGDVVEESGHEEKSDEIQSEGEKIPGKGGEGEGSERGLALEQRTFRPARHCHPSLGLLLRAGGQILKGKEAMFSMG
jgi:hypothetical protein